MKATREERIAATARTMIGLSPDDPTTIEKRIEEILDSPPARKGAMWLGAWKITPFLRASLWSWGLGLEVQLRSWRSAYPWLYAAGMIGCISFGIEAARPPEARKRTA